MSSRSIKIGIPLIPFLWIAGGVALSILPFAICFYLNFNEYEWLVTAISWEIAIWSFAVSILYHKNRYFYLALNRCLLFFTTSHTYWLPAFRFTLSDNSCKDNNMFLKNLLDDIQNESIAKLILRTNVLSVTKAEIEIEKGDRYIFDFDGVSLFISTDRVLTVPRGLYKKKSNFLIGFVEKIRELTEAISISSEIQIQFEDKKNPYYGFFVNSLPADILDSFDVSFRTDTESECIVIANNDGITIKGKNLLDTFTTLKGVLLLQPLNNLS